MPVFYFYFKYQDPARDSFVTLARALIGQAAIKDHTVLSHIYNEQLKSPEKPLSSFKFSSNILVSVLKSFNSACIILDGLDECKYEEIEKIGSWFMKFVRSAHDATLNIRCLFSSQNDSCTNKIFKAAPSLALSASNIAVDLRIYCGAKATEVQEKFRLDDENKEKIIEKVLAESKGDFIQN